MKEQEEYPSPVAKQCPSCNSYQVTERREQKGNAVILKLHCNACRRDLLFWTGSRAEERLFKKRRRNLLKILGM